jgi:hypothetical protein
MNWEKCKSWEKAEAEKDKIQAVRHKVQTVSDSIFLINLMFHFLLFPFITQLPD